ncbi:MAG: hypothetical protein MJZ37_09500 [Bacilli bacterium]|nr:hypothetical protein [Bacilli bacterium]
MSWNFSIDNYAAVWAAMIQLFILIAFVLVGNILRRVIPFLKKSYIPSSLIGGLLLFIINLICKAVSKGSFLLVNPDLMKITTYHALAIGFIAMSLKNTGGSQNKELVKKSTQNGLMTGAVYMLQATFGILTVLIFFALGKSIFYDAGVILPLSFGQGPGNALTWDINFSDSAHMSMIGSDGLMDTNGSFGLTMASIGFIVSAIVGVIYINYFRVKGQIVRTSDDNIDEEIELVSDNEVNKRSANLGIQLGVIAICYLMTFGIMCALSFSDFTKSIAWGFNFIFGVISANLVKVVINFLRKKNVIKQEVINNRQVSKISDFAFDLMIIAGVAAIEIENIVNYIGVIIALSIVGTIITYVYVRIMTRRVFKGYEHDMFLVNFGTLTGTASNGMILLRESDPTFSRDSANIFIISQLPAMIAVAPLLLLLNFSAKSLTNCFIAVGIFFALAVVYTVIILILNKKNVAKAE